MIPALRARAEEAVDLVQEDDGRSQLVRQRKQSVHISVIPRQHRQYCILRDRLPKKLTFQSRPPIWT